MSLEIGRDLGLFVWIVTALCASITTGSIVGVIVSTPMRTYQLAAWVFLGGAITWLMTSFLGGAVMRFLLDALIMQRFLLFGLMAGLLSIGLSYVLVRLEQANRALRWSLLGAMSAWLAVAIGTATAYQHLMASVKMVESAMPANFWPCIMFSTAICTVLGACVGGMLFRHRQLWRN
jgi:hypothetical protein